MKPLDLPAELLLEVLKHTVVIVGFPRAFRLRLVSTFDCEVLRAIFATHLIQDLPYRHFDPIGVPIISKYLEARTLPDATNSNALIAGVQRIARTFMKEEKDEFSKPEWRMHIQALCCAAITTMGCSWVIHYLSADSTVSDKIGERSRDYLAAAAYTGRLARVRSMIEEGCDAILESRYFGYPLQAAASGGHMDCVLLLLEKENDVITSLEPAGPMSRKYLVYRNIETALPAASRAGHEGIVRLLSQSKYESQVSHQIYDSAAWNAAQMGHANIVRFLLDRIQPARRSRLQEMILLTASTNGHEDIAQLMLDHGTDVHANLSDRDQPMHRAAAGGHYKIVQVLLAAGAQQIEGEHGTPLHEVARRGFVKVAQVLIEHRADIHACWPAPIVVAALRGHAHMVEFLIEKGENLDLDGGGQEALCYAARNGHESIIRLLAGRGVDVDGTAEGHNPLLNAIIKGHDRVARALVELGAERRDPLESRFAKRHAKFLAKRTHFNGRRMKAERSYDDHMLAYKRLDESLFTSASSASSSLISTT